MILIFLKNCIYFEKRKSLGMLSPVLRFKKSCKRSYTSTNSSAVSIWNSFRIHLNMQILEVFFSVYFRNLFHSSCMAISISDNSSAKFLPPRNKGFSIRISLAAPTSNTYANNSLNSLPVALSLQVLLYMECYF